MKHRKSLLALGLAVAIGLGVISLGAATGRAASIIDQWASVKAPPAPTLKPVTVDPKTTALLMLDFVQQACNPQNRKRCANSLPAVKKLLDAARSSGTMVVYTAYGKNTKSDVVPEVAAKDSEPLVVAFLNKYRGTELEKMLKDKSIETVITVGTAAHGAVLTTASASAELGFKVIVPVDGISANELYAEQYTAWDLVNAPVIASKVTLTAIGIMKF